jgi:hypothetical protein
MSQHPPVSAVSVSYADAVRRLAKDEWFAFESNRRSRIGISMTEPLDSWQIWNADPTELPALVEGADEQPSGFAFTKLFPAEPDINRFITFRPAVVVSNSRSHSLGRALVCPMTQQQHRRNGTVVLPPAPHRKKGGVILAGRLRSVDGDLQAPVEERELLCINVLLEEQYRSPVLTEIEGLIVGRWPTKTSCKPGAVVTVKGDDTYHGMVIATCALAPPRVEYDVALVAMSFDATSAEQLGDLSPADGELTGAAPIEWTDSAGTTRSTVFDVLGVMSARCSDLTVIGAASSVGPAQRLLSAFITET